MLRPYQTENAERLIQILQRNRGAADCSDTGTGKTWTAAHVIRRLGVPTLVVCPKTAMTHWQQVLAACEADGLATVINYERLLRGKASPGRWAGTQFIWPHHVQLIVWDEAHRCKSRTSQTTRMLISAVRQRKRNLLLSATLCQEPIEMKGIGEALGFFASGQWSNWLKAQGYALGNRGTWEWMAGKEKREKILARIREYLLTCSVRTRWQDIEGFPGRAIVAKLVDLELEKIKELNDTLDLTNYKPQALEEFVTWRRALELAKVPTLAQLVRGFVEQGFSVAVFLEFILPILELQSELETDQQKVLVLRGNTTNRDEVIGLFQSNKVPVIIVQTHTGGQAISLGDETGERPRIGLVTPVWSARAMLQIFGRLHRVSSKTPCLYYVVYAAKTLEEKVYHRMSQKLALLNTIHGLDTTIITDLDLIPDEFHDFFAPRHGAGQPAEISSSVEIPQDEDWSMGVPDTLLV